jgi:hypothetical protein
VNLSDPLENRHSRAIKSIFVNCSVSINLKLKMKKTISITTSDIILPNHSDQMIATDNEL